MTTVAAAPARAPGLELLGSLPDSGYSSTQHLVRRADGQTVQVTALLHALLEELDGRRGPEELAEALSQRIGKRATADDVQDLLGRLRPLGMLAGDEAQVRRKPQPLLGLRWRFVVSDPTVTRRITAPFAQLFRPWVLWPVLAAFVAVCWFVLVDKGLASATRQAFYEPEQLLLVFGLVVLSAGFHEFGHAAACRYGGGTPGAMGAGLYLVWPAFYTDVDDSYRLPRKDRLRVDLGGLYFNAVAAVAVWGVWFACRQDALLLAVAVQLLQMVRQLPPVIRADGYHIVADLTGVPDLYRHLGPTLRRLLPWHWRDPSPLRRRARWAITAWTLVVTPVIVSMLLTGVLLLPKLVATAWAGGQVQLHRMATTNPLVIGAATLKLIALVLPVLAVGGIAIRLVRKGFRSVSSWTDGHPARRRTVVLAALVAAAVLLSAWWPRGQWEPVHAVDQTPVPVAAASPHRVAALALVPRDDEHPVLLVLPGKDRPQAVLTSTSGSGTTATAGKAFPFQLPDAPGEGDTQALAVNRTDGATVYDVAYALVTVTDGAPVTSRNEAWALASCARCTTVAVAFQVVLVVGTSKVVVPVNTAVAGNSSCLACTTAALAVQLVATVSQLPDEEVYDDLQAALGKLDGLEQLDVDELWSTVQGVKKDVVDVLVAAGIAPDLAEAVASATPGATATASAPASPLVTATSTAAATTTPAPSASPSAGPTSTPAATASATP